MRPNTLVAAVALVEADSKASNFLHIERDPYTDLSRFACYPWIPGANHRRAHRDLPNNRPKDKATKRRRAQNRVARASRKKNRK